MGRLMIYLDYVKKTRITLALRSRNMIYMGVWACDDDVLLCIGAHEFIELIRLKSSGKHRPYVTTQSCRLTPPQRMPGLLFGSAFAPL